jgi:hypothetical protein
MCLATGIMSSLSPNSVRQSARYYRSYVITIDNSADIEILTRKSSANAMKDLATGACVVCTAESTNSGTSFLY